MNYSLTKRRFKCLEEYYILTYKIHILKICMFYTKKIPIYFNWKESVLKYLFVIKHVLLGLLLSQTRFKDLTTHVRLIHKQTYNRKLLILTDITQLSELLHS